MPDVKNETSVDDVDTQSKKIIEVRKRPLLILYYPDMYGSMRDEDVKDLYGEFRRRKWTRDADKRSLDVLIHTFGGDPIASYRIAQVIRDFTNHVIFLVPEHAYSGGTLTCLSGDEIRLGAYAVLSPIDITLGSGEVRDRVQLLNIDYFMEFVQDCRRQIERMLKKERVTAGTKVDCELLVEMTKQVGALNVGRFFRERTLTGHYADRLLKDYMLSGRLNREHLSQEIIRKLLFEMPSHSFEMDYHICKEIGLPVEEMSEQESDITKELITMLEALTRTQTICKDIEKDYKMPFFRLYYEEESAGDASSGTN